MPTPVQEGASVAPNDQFQADFNGTYEMLRYARGFPGGPVQYFGQNKVCRYCSQTDPKKFKMMAHLVPEALGNTCLISRDECDDCNAKFSEYESNLSDALRPVLTVCGMAGKDNKVPQSGRTSGLTTIRHTTDENGRHLSFVTSAGNPEFGVTADGSYILSFPAPAVTFKPRLAYKALAKMAYALLPDDELCHYTKLRAWLLDKTDTVEFQGLEVGLSFGSLGNAPKIVSAALLRRVNPTDRTPYIIFVLCAGSVCLMVDLMSDDMEEHLGWDTMGRIDFRWAAELGPNREVRIEYDKFRPMNWAPLEKAYQPLDKLVLHFNPKTLQGRFTPVLRPEWS